MIFSSAGTSVHCCLRRSVRCVLCASVILFITRVVVFSWNPGTWNAERFLRSLEAFPGKGGRGGNHRLDFVEGVCRIEDDAKAGRNCTVNGSSTGTYVRGTGYRYQCVIYGCELHAQQLI